LVVQPTDASSQFAETTAAPIQKAEPVEAQELVLGAVLLATRDVALIPGMRTEGYLAPIFAGDDLEILHVNEPGEEDEWVFARRIASPQDQGWVLSDVVDPAAAAPTYASDLEDHGDEAVGGPSDGQHSDVDPSVPVSFSPGDEVFHLRPGGECSVLKEQPSGEAGAIDSADTLGHNAPASVLAVQGEWVQVRIKSGSASSYGWLPSAYLRFAPLPSGPPPVTSALRGSRRQSTPTPDCVTGSSTSRRKVSFLLPESPASSVAHAK
jgi:hypothetical protein